MFVKEQYEIVIHGYICSFNNNEVLLTIFFFGEYGVHFCQNHDLVENRK